MSTDVNEGAVVAVEQVVARCEARHRWVNVKDLLADQLSARTVSL